MSNLKDYIQQTGLIKWQFGIFLAVANLWENCVESPISVPAGVHDAISVMQKLMVWIENIQAEWKIWAWWAQQSVARWLPSTLEATAAAQLLTVHHVWKGESGTAGPSEGGTGRLGWERMWRGVSSESGTILLPCLPAGAGQVCVCSPTVASPVNWVWLIFIIFAIYHFTTAIYLTIWTKWAEGAVKLSDTIFGGLHPAAIVLPSALCCVWATSTPCQLYWEVGQK